MTATIVTRKGPVNVPDEIRDALGLHDGDIVSVEQNHDGILLRRTTSVVDQLYGSLGRYMTRPSMTSEEEREAFERGVAAEFAAEEADSK